MRPAITTILVPTDFSAASARALAYARDLAALCGASLHLLHVIEVPAITVGYIDAYTAPPPDYLESLVRASHNRLAELLSSEDKERFHAVLADRMGSPAREILDYIDGHPEINLVVMATEGRGAVARLMIGSVAGKVVRAARCPVLAIHAHDRPAQSTAAA